LNGSIALTGAVVDDLSLTDYRETVAPDSPEIVLLSPKGALRAYFAEFGWLSRDPGEVPGADALWRADRQVLTVDQAVTLSWDNGRGLSFSRTFAVDKNYMFTVTERVTNRGASPVELYPYGLISRAGTPATTGFYILHEGPLGVIAGQLEEYDYSDLKDDGPAEWDSAGGWLGITDKYWLIAIVPEAGRAIHASFRHRSEGGDDRYQVDYVGREPQLVAPGASVELTSRMFAGAKEVRLLEGYAESLGIERLDRAVVFRWLYFVAEPVFYLLDYFRELLGNFGLAIILLTVLIKALFFPLANKSYRSMSRMKNLQPEMTKIRERYKDDRQRMNQEMMQLYKREKVNPASGCLPMVVQIPVFFCLYEVLFVTIEMRHAPFYGWIRDLSAPDPTTVFNLFGLIPFQPPEFLMIGAWPLIMGLSMFLQQKLNPQPADPVQARIFMFLPIIFTVILAQFPAGLVIYWTWNNVLSIAQQWLIMRQTKRGAKS